MDEYSFLGDTPRVEALIEKVAKKFPGHSKSALARYYEEVHQELAPLAREIERENVKLRRCLNEIQIHLGNKTK